MLINEDFFDEDIMTDAPVISQEEPEENDIPNKGEYSFVFQFGLDGAAANLKPDRKTEVGKELNKFKMAVRRILEPFCSYMSDVIYVIADYSNNWA